MEACIYKKFGKASVLEWVSDWPTPACGPDSVLIKIAASSINPKDALLRSGKFSRTFARDKLPRLTGMDASGIIIEIGSNVTQFSVGDSVLGMTNNFSGGILGTYAVLKESEIAKAPISIPLSESASIPLAALTALQALRDICCVTHGKKILITGASGGVGSFAVQIAKVLGAVVHGVCSVNNIDFVYSLGAHHVYDYNNQDLSVIDDDYDVIFDVAGRYQRNYFSKQIKKKGIFVSTVPKGTILLSEVLAQLGINKTTRLVFVKSKSEDLEQLVHWVDKEKITLHIEKIYDQKDIAEAHTHIQHGHTRGKIIVELAPTGQKSTTPSQAKG